jgi:hypothetical protein
MKAKRKSTVALRLPPAFVAMCEGHGVEPDQVLRGFIADLCMLRTADYNTHGSDERMLAEHYYLRCGYPYLRPWPPTKVLVPWHIDEYGNRSRTVGSERNGDD